MLRSAIVALACCLCVILSSVCCADSLVDSEAIVRPTRPKNFASPDDLRVYLDQLGQYYAVVGRPRFGKRVLVNRQQARREELAGYGPLQRQPSIPSDVLEILQDYQLQAK